MSEQIRMNVNAVRVEGFKFECPVCKKRPLALDQEVLALLSSGREVHTKCPCGQPVAMRMLVYKPNTTIMNRKMRRRVAAEKKGAL